MPLLRKLITLKRILVKNVKLKNKQLLFLTSFVPVIKAASNGTENSKQIIFKSNSEKLTHEYLVKQAANCTANSAAQLLTQTVVAIFDIGEQYSTALSELMNIIEKKKEFNSKGVEDQTLADLTIAYRAKTDDLKKQLNDFYSLLEFVEKVIQSTAEVSFISGSEYVSISLTEKLNFSKQQLLNIQERIQNLENEYLIVQKNEITSSQ